MTAALLLGLLGYAAVISIVGPRLLRTSQASYARAPRFGLVLWIVTITSWVVALLSAGLTAIALLTDGHGLAALLRACLRALVALSSPHDPTEAAASIAFLGSMLFAARLLSVGVRHLRRTRRHRRDHCRELCRSTACWSRPRGITLVRSADASAYCVPGPARTIVITTGVLESLSWDEVHAVLAHERAHLAGRHHLWLGWASVLAHSFAFVPLLRAAPVEVARLVEWIADDRSARRYGDRTVARALTAMATHVPSGTLRAPTRERARDGSGVPPYSSPGVALTATGSGVPERVRRLLHRGTAGRLAYGRGVLTLTIGVLALAVAAATLIPAATADPRPLCTASPTLGQR